MNNTFPLKEASETKLETPVIPRPPETFKFPAIPPRPATFKFSEIPTPPRTVNAPVFEFMDDNGLIILTEVFIFVFPAIELPMVIEFPNNDIDSSTTFIVCPILMVDASPPINTF